MRSIYATLGVETPVCPSLAADAGCSYGEAHLGSGYWQSIRTGAESADFGSVDMASHASHLGLRACASCTQSWDGILDVMLRLPSYRS